MATLYIHFLNADTKPDVIGKVQRVYPHCFAGENFPVELCVELDNNQLVKYPWTNIKKYWLTHQESFNVFNNQ